MSANKPTPGYVEITIDSVEMPAIPNGAFDDSRELAFVVTGDGEIVVSDFDIHGIWIPATSRGPEDTAQFIGDDFPFPGSRTIKAGETARLLTLERNRIDIERVYSVTVRPSVGAEYIPEGEHSPPRMVVPRKR